MKHIPPELDGLMWTLAENPDARALDEFGERYPTYRAELGKRIALVRTFRGARPHEPKSAPRFSPRPAPRPAWRPVPVLAGLAALLTLGFAGYWGAVKLAPRNVERPPDVVAANVDPVQLPDNGGVVYQDKPQAQQPPMGDTATPPNAPLATPALDQTQDLRVDNTFLQSAIQLLAEGSGYTVLFAPGMPNPTISTDYRSTRAKDILADLGREYGFTIFEEGNGQLLAIPAVNDVPQDRPQDPNAASGQDAREPTLDTETGPTGL